MIPSVKTLRRLFPDSPEGRRDAVRLRRLLDGRDDPCQYDAVNRWLDQCYNTPRREELVMCAADQLLDTCGVEALACEGWHGGYTCNVHAVYCNTGDSYGLTLLRDNAEDRYHVVSWGDYVEGQERKNGDCFPRESEG